MDETLYDEFGNYIGPALKSSDEEESESESEEEYELEEEQKSQMEEREQLHDANGYSDLSQDVNAMVVHEENNQDMMEESSIVLHEDKKYYPDAHEVYGEAEVLVMEEDAQPIEKPIIEPVKIKSFSVLEKSVPKTTYSTEFLTSLMQHPSLIRNIAIVGNLHHGKTAFMDLLIEQTHENEWDPEVERRYTDTRQDEQQRELSIKSTPVSLVLENTKGKSFLLNVMDCPGHVNFMDESTAAFQVCDGAVFVVDAIEGITLPTKRLIQHALDFELSITLVINKVDRLIIELKIPPADAYHKLVYIIEQMNSIIQQSQKGLVQQNKSNLLSPEKGNVCFAGAQHGWCFTLESFAQLYKTNNKKTQMDTKAFAKKLWGNQYFCPKTRSFTRNVPYSGASRSFVQFILEPLYKVYSQVLSEDTSGLMKTLKELNVQLRRESLHLNPKPLLKLVFRRWMSQASGFVNMVTSHFPSPVENAPKKIEQLYTGLQTSAGTMKACDPNGDLCMNVVKLYSSPDGKSFTAFGRIYSGQIKIHDRVKVLGETYSEEDDEDMVTQQIKGVYVGQGRYRLSLQHAVSAGNWVLIDGIEASITKTATITSANDMSGIGIFRPLRFPTEAVVKLAVEPHNPAELPKMLDGLRKINRSYLLATTKVEESGEHIILCTGELAADIILHDLRQLYSDIEIKVADPVVCFTETVQETSSVQCSALTPNKQNTLTMIAEPLDQGLTEDIEQGHVPLHLWSTKKTSDFFQSKYHWDILAARSVWAFGPDAHSGPNVLINDTLPSEVDPILMSSPALKDSIVRGFQWACREGPLCDEPIRSTKFKILDAQFSGAGSSSSGIHRGAGQIIPTARRVVYSSFLTASPRLMEPVYALEIHCPADTVSSLYQVLSRRRGHIVQDSPIPGSPLYSVSGYLPVIESFGFETDLRVYTQGQACCSQVFDHWAVVPGDPLDASIVLRPLEPSPPNHLAREFMVKTRRRKGLSEDVSIHKFMDNSSSMFQGPP